MTTMIQAREQTDGPHRPRADLLATLIDSVSKCHEIRAVSINGQTGTVVVEVMHEEMPMNITFLKNAGRYKRL